MDSNSTRLNNGTSRLLLVGDTEVSQCCCNEAKDTSAESRFRRQFLRQNISKAILMSLALVGFIYLISNFLFIITRSTWDYSHDPDSIFSNWGSPGTGTEPLAWYPTNFLRDVIPIPAHSHNDYWRTVPLFSAIHVGCTSVEADVWQFEGDTELYVGHDLPSLTKNRTFSNLYIKPLVSILELMNPTTPFYTPSGSMSRCANGIFDTDQRQTLVLLVDVKTDGIKTWPLVMAQLQPLRERGWLTHVDGNGNVILGPITIVGSGNTPFDQIVGNSTFRDAFFDAPLEKMFENEDELDEILSGALPILTSERPTDYDVYNHTNSFYASASISKALGPVWFATGGISEYQRYVMKGQIRGAHRRGLKVRYWRDRKSVV